MNERPAEGIAKRKSFKDFEVYEVLCECQNNEHNHALAIEYNEGTKQIEVTISATTSTPFWNEVVSPYPETENGFLYYLSCRVRNVINSFAERCRITLEVWTHGRCKYEASLILSERAARNYSAALSKSIDDIKARAAAVSSEE